MLPDYLRGIAALGVFLFHRFEQSPIPFVAHGYRWVDVFFILSGFLLSYVYSNTKVSRFQFIIKRIRRIYPLLFYTTVISFLGQLYFGRILPEKNTLYSLIDTLLLCNSTPLFGVYNFGHVVSWSVSAEMFAYCVSAVVWNQKSKIKLVIWSFVVIFGIIFLWNRGLIQEVRFGFIRGLIGYGVGVIAFNMSRLKVNQSFNIFFVLCFLSSFYVANDNFSLLIMYVSLGMLMPILFDKESNLRIPKSSILKYLGLRSYSIYLNHNILLFLLVMLPKFWWCSLIFWLVYNEIVYKLVEQSQMDLKSIYIRFVTFLNK